jgi:zinc protease
MLNRSIAPAFSKKFSFDLPSAEIVHLSAGLDLVFLPGVQQEVIRLEVIFRAGKWFEPDTGVSHFTAIMIEKGTITRSSKQIAEIFDYYGAQVEISPGADFTSVSLYALKKHLHEIFPVFWEILVSPEFNEEELNLQKEIFIQNLKINNQKNSFVASRLLRKNIFGDNHPYGRTIEEEDVHRITKEELKTFFAKNFSPIEIYLAGNLNPHEIDWLIQQLNAVTSRKIGEKNFLAMPGLFEQTLPRKESIQSSIRLGKQIINRLHRDYFSLLLLNHILGGYFGSRLMKSIREEKGLTYGIYSAIHPFKNDCMISIGADVNHNKLELAKEEIKNELKILKEIPVSEDELTISKNHFLGSLQLEMANPFAVLDKIKSIRLNDLGENYYNDLIATIESSNPEGILSTAKKYFDPDSFQEVSVG